MNLPNKLTVMRIALVPVLVALMMRSLFLAAFVCFVAASLTDLLDGQIARRYHLVTTFGKLMDPLADKVLVMAAMLCLVEIGMAPAWMVIVILAREFLVTSLRLVAAGEGTVIAADRFGKAKTVLQMAWIICSLAYLSCIRDTAFVGYVPVRLEEMLLIVTDLLALGALVMTIISGFNYIWRNGSIMLRDV